MESAVARSETSEKRVCGFCAACCRTHSVPEIQKLRGKWCIHCDKGHNLPCTVYEVRPQGCRDFACAWLKGWGTDFDRPDRVKIVVDWKKIGQGLAVVRLWPVNEETPLSRVKAIGARLVQPLIAHLESKGYAVVKEIQTLGKERDAVGPPDLSEPQKAALRAYLQTD